MLNNLHIKNFKAARDVSLELGALTVLAGLNGSGKSSVLQSLALLKQSHELSSQENAGLYLRGDYVKLGKSEDVLNESGDNELAFTLTTKLSTIKVSCIGEIGSNFLPLQSDPASFNTMSETLFKDFQFIQADRLTPATQYIQATGSRERKGWLGTRGEYAVHFLSTHAGNTISPNRAFPRDALGVSEELYKIIAPTSNLLDQVTGWLQQLSPGVKLRAEDIPLTDEVSLRYRYTNTGLSDETNDRRPTNVGFGLTYCLPIIIACLSAPAGAMLLLENPEAHLHPQGQAALGMLLALCAIDGVQIIVETHSDHLLNGVRLAVKRAKETDKNFSVLHYFTRRLEEDDCYVQSPAILPDGQLTNWPTGFMDQWERDLNQLLD